MSEVPTASVDPRLLQSGAAAAETAILNTLWGNYFAAIKDGAGKLRI